MVLVLVRSHCIELGQSVLSLVESCGHHHLICSIPALYTKEYGRLPVVSATGKTCVKDVIKSVCFLQGSTLTETRATLQSQPGEIILFSPPPTSTPFFSLFGRREACEFMLIVLVSCPWYLVTLPRSNVS